MSAVNNQFTATLQKSPNKRGWTYVLWTGSVQFFRTRGLVKGVGRSTASRFATRSWRSAMADTSCQFGPTSVSPSQSAQARQ
jgi:hypothetical protein